MPNSIDAHVEFSFKGETHYLSATIELDEFLGPGATLPSIHALLAGKNGIDTYSYLYEVMLEEEIRFDNAQGLAAEFLTDGEFDLDAYFIGLQEQKTLSLLQAIATRELDVADFDQQPALKNALLQAYNLGKAS